MVRQIVVPTQNTYLLRLPDHLVGKTIEVIAFEIEAPEPTRPQKTMEELKAELQGLTVNQQGFAFSRDEANDYE